MKLLSKWKRRWVRWRRLRHCRYCRAVMRPRWVKDVVLFEDEPPLFAHWECPACNRKLTPVYPTAITEQTLLRLGYRDIAEYVDQVCVKNVTQQEVPVVKARNGPSQTEEAGPAH